MVSPWSLPRWLCSPDFNIVFVLSWGYLTLPHLKQVIWLLTDSLLWIYNVSIDISAHVKEVVKISQVCDTEKLELGPRTAGLLNCHLVILATEKKMVEPSEFFWKKNRPPKIWGLLSPLLFLILRLWIPANTGTKAPSACWLKKQWN